LEGGEGKKLKLKFQSWRDRLKIEREEGGEERRI